MFESAPSVHHLGAWLGLVVPLMPHPISVCIPEWMSGQFVADHIRPLLFDAFPKSAGSS